MLRLMKHRRFWFAALAATLSLLTPGLVAAQSTPSPLLPASPNASLVAGLYWIVFWMAVVVFLLVEGLLIYASIRFRRRDDAELPVQVYGNARAEVAWTIGPSLIAAAITVLSLQVMLQDRTPTEDGVSAVSVASVCFSGDISSDQAAQFLASSTVTIEVTGAQWWWELNYVDHGFITAAEMFVPVGEVVSLRMTSRDVVHSWWIPQLGGKQDVYPGTNTYTWFQVTEQGIYEGHCTEMCGNSHAYMPMRVIAVERDVYDAWVARQLADVPEPVTDLEVRGQELFTEKGCVSCHGIQGVANVSRTGPNLSNMGGRLQIAGMMRNNPENMREWLADPLMKPGSKMPDMNLTEEELDAMVAYLNTLK
jgi:cytochrome c oxidase subunit 2